MEKSWTTVGPQPAWPLPPPVDPRGSPEGMSRPSASSAVTCIARPWPRAGPEAGYKFSALGAGAPAARRRTRMQGWLSQTCDLSLAF